MALEIILAILGIAFLILAAFSIPFLLQIWRTTKSMTETLNLLNQSLPGILKNLEDITTNINKATQTVNTQIDGLSAIATRVQGILGVVTDVENLLRAGIGLPVFKTLRNAIAVATGIKVFLRVLISSRESE